MCIPMKKVQDTDWVAVYLLCVLSFQEMCETSVCFSLCNRQCKKKCRAFFLISKLSAEITKSSSKNKRGLQRVFRIEIFGSHEAKVSQ